MGRGTVVSGVISGWGLTTRLDTATNDVHFVAREWLSPRVVTLNFSSSSLNRFVGVFNWRM
jgi:hypothetical protein